MVRSIKAACTAVILAWTALGLASLPAQAQEKVIRFGASLSLTGKLSTEGRLVKDGYDLYVKMANERGGIMLEGLPHKVEILYYDDESDAKKATALVERLINQDKVNFILGPYSSGVTLAASTVSERYEMPMIAAHAASTTIYDRGYKYIFGVLTSVDQYTINMINMAKEQGAKSLALINENALFPQLGIDGAAEQAKAAGMEVIYKENYPSGTTDFLSMLSSAWATKPDVIISGGYTGDMVVIAKQAAELNIKPKMMGFLLGPTSPGFVDSVGAGSEGVLEPIQWSANMTYKDDLFGITSGEYAELFEKEYGYRPDYHPPQSSAAMIVYHKAIEKAESLDPKKVRDAIAATDIMTFYGPIRFNERGQNIAKGMGVVQIQGGSAKVVYPTKYKEADLVYPRQ